MADYFKMRIIGTYSPNSDYSDPVVEFDWAVDESPNECELRRVEAVSGGTTVTVSYLDDPLLLVCVRNRDTSNYVDVAYTQGAAGSGTNTVRILAGQVAVLPDVQSNATNLTLTTASSAVMCDVFTLAS